MVLLQSYLQGFRILVVVRQVGGLLLCYVPIPQSFFMVGLIMFKGSMINRIAFGESCFICFPVSVTLDQSPTVCWKAKLSNVILLWCLAFGSTGLRPYVLDRVPVNDSHP
jgi:hypothetical protein